jgi:chromate transporter
VTEDGVTENPAWTMAVHFLLLSLVAVGGANTVLPSIHHLVVEANEWMTGDEFSELFAIAQAAPGPNVMVVTLIGWHVAGFPGAVASTLAICTPSSLLAYAVAQVWYRFRGRPWRAALQAGLAPMTVGLILAAGYVVTRGADHNAAAYGLTAASVAVFLFTKLNPLWLFAVGGALGLLGVV